MLKYIAEFIGTFALVFVGTGSVIVNEETGNSLGLIGVSIVFGVTVSGMMYALGSISGAHINPAVTIAFYSNKGISKKDAILYVLAQVIGAIAASFVLQSIFPNNRNLGGTIPSESNLSAGIIEFVATFLLLLTLLGITHSQHKKIKPFAGLLIGLLITGLIFVAGPISGGSFNPARSLGPVIISGNFSSATWIYLFFPIMGGLLAVITFNRILNRNLKSN